MELYRTIQILRDEQQNDNEPHNELGADGWMNWSAVVAKIGITRAADLLQGKSYLNGEVVQQESRSFVEGSDENDISMDIVDGDKKENIIEDINNLNQDTKFESVHPSLPIHLIPVCNHAVINIEHLLEVRLISRTIDTI